MSTTHTSYPSASQSLSLLVSRLLMAWLFLPAGIGKITGLAGTAGYVASKGLPMPEVMTVLAIIAEVGGGIALLIGFKTRWAAWGLALFSVAAAVFFHNYWALPLAEQAMQQINFTKNLAIAGGLLALSVCGAGAWSVDGARRDA